MCHHGPSHFLLLIRSGIGSTSSEASSANEDSIGLATCQLPFINIIDRDGFMEGCGRGAKGIYAGCSLSSPNDSPRDAPPGSPRTLGQHLGLRKKRQVDNHFGELSGFGFDPDGTPVLAHDIVGQRQTEARSLIGRLGGEKRVENFFDDLRRDPVAVVPDPHLDALVQAPGGHGQSGFVFPSIFPGPASFVGGVAGVAHHV